MILTDTSRLSRFEIYLCCPGFYSYILCMQELLQTLSHRNTILLEATSHSVTRCPHLQNHHSPPFPEKFENISTMPYSSTSARPSPVTHHPILNTSRQIQYEYTTAMIMTTWCSRARHPSSIWCKNGLQGRTSRERLM